MQEYILEHKLLQKIIFELNKLGDTHEVTGVYFADENLFVIKTVIFHKEHLDLLYNYGVSGFLINGSHDSGVEIRFKLDLVKTFENIDLFEVNKTFDGVIVNMCGVLFKLYEDSNCDVERYSGKSMFTFHKKIDVRAYKEEEQETLQFHRTLIIKLLSSCNSLKNCLFDI